MGQLAVRLVNERGRPLPRIYTGSLRFAAMDYEPYPNHALGLSTGEGRATLSAPAEPFQVAMVLPVDGFGAVYAYADNAGEGYTGSEKEIDFTFEAARSRLAKVRRWLGAQGAFRASAAVEERLGAAEDCLKRAQRAVAASEERTSAALASLRESLWAGETAAIERARYDIARRAPREGFLFGGANLISRPFSQRKRGLFTGLFNYATVVLHWRVLEPERGQKAWARTDELLDWLEEHHITPKGHPLAWMHGPASPDWVLKDRYRREFEAYKDLVIDRAYDLADRYRGRIDVFDVINEAHDWANIYDYDEAKQIELTGLVCDVARDANPEMVRVINTLWEWGQYVPSGSYHSLEGTRQSSRPLMSPVKYFHRCLEANINFEAVGLQVHNPVHDMLEIGLMLDRYAAFGKPIHITELGVPSAPIEAEAMSGHIGVEDYAAVTSTGVNLWGHPHAWHGSYNEDVQADWYEQFYTLCYSKPHVTAVTNWLWDDCGTAMGLTSLMAKARGERPKGWPPHTGLVKTDLTPKQSYYRLKRLIEGWDAPGKGV